MAEVKYSDAVQSKMERFQIDVLTEVRRAIEENDVVVVGMGWNPHVAQARKALTAAGVDFTYVGYGNYLTGWKQRLAIKLWSGWPTFPQVFVNGALIGGNKLTRAAIQDGSLKARLQQGAPEQQGAPAQP